MRVHHTTKRSYLEPLELRRLLSFAVGGDYAIGGYPESVAVADFNNDGRADFATGTQNPDVIRVMLGNANGTFTPGQQLAASTPHSLDAGDMNGDGKIDLVATMGSPHLQIFAGNGNGTFQAPHFVSIPPPPNPPWTFFNINYATAVTIADVDGDGKNDLVAGCEYAYPDPDHDPESPNSPHFFYENYFCVLRGTGNGTFATSFVQDGLGATDVEAADLNEDGKLDLVLGVSDWIIVLLGVGNGTFTDGPSYLWIQGVGAGFTLADFNGDGHLDVASQYASVALGNGNGGFGPPQHYTAGGSWLHSVATGDFNKDGRPDLVFGDRGGSTGGEVRVLLNEDGVGFRAPLVFPCAAGAAYSFPFVAAADFNGDGRVDVAVSSYSGGVPGSANVRLLVNDGNWGGKTWIGPASGGNWSTAANWTPSGVPGAGDHVTIAGTSVNLSASVTVASLALTSGATLAVAADDNRVLRTSSLSISSNSTLNLGDNDLVLDYSGVSPVGIWTGSAYDGVTGMIESGRLTSSLASDNLNTLGVAEAREALGITGSQTGTCSGQSVDSISLLVKFTWGGDANLDGKINIDDYGRIDGNVAESGAVFGWFRGDFNLDGKINIDDYGIIDGNVASQDALDSHSLKL